MLHWFQINHLYSKEQVVHKQKFKDPLSSTYQVSSKRSVRFGIRGPRFSRHWEKHFITGIFCHHIVKPLMLIMALLPILCVCEKPDCISQWRHHLKQVLLDAQSQLPCDKSTSCPLNGLAEGLISKWISLSQYPAGIKHVRLQGANSTYSFSAEHDKW